MADIYHQVGIKGTPIEIYDALTVDAKLAGWWTTEVQGAGDSMLGGDIKFRFNGFGPDMRIIRLDPPKAIRWKCTAGHPEWVDTELNFEIKKTYEQTFVNFRHEGFRIIDEFYASCNTKWGVFLLSLKRFVEKGEGRPYPSDVPINHSKV